MSCNGDEENFITKLYTLACFGFLRDFQKLKCFIISNHFGSNVAFNFYELRAENFLKTKLNDRSQMDNYGGDETRLSN